MKILLINNLYKSGSTGKIVYDIKTDLDTKGYSTYVCYGRGERSTENRVYKFATELEAKLQALLTRFGFLQYGGNYLATKRLISKLVDYNPDVVHIHCLNGYCVNIYRLLRFLAIHRIKTVITHHAEFYYTGSCGHAYDCMKWKSEFGCRKCPSLYEATHSRLLDFSHMAWQKMKTAFALFHNDDLMFTAVSPWVLNRASCSTIVNSFPSSVVYNGLDTDIFCYRGDRPIQNREQYCLHVTANFSDNINDNKGGYYIIELAKSMPNVKFLVIASYSSLHKELPPNVIYIGRVSNQHELAKYYQDASLTIITSYRETFSMITAESLSCGTPVVGFKAGAPEQIAIAEYATFVDYGDLKALKDSIISKLETTFDKRDISAAAVKLYSKETMTNKYESIYHTIYGK